MTDSTTAPRPTPVATALRAAPEETIVRANGVDLCAQTFGDPDDPAILLIHGATTSMLGWEEAFCRRLAAGPRFVVRYDHRDTGRSVSYPPGAPPYAFHDLTEDALALLDLFGLERAHLVGCSMGGGIAMQAALEHPARVASLTLVATSPGGPGLPPMSPAFLAHVGGPAPDWSDREAVIEHVLAFLRVITADPDRFDAERWRPLIAHDVDRTRDVAAGQINHFAMQVGEPIRDRLGEITAPTLIIHGALDPVFPLGHAHSLRDEIPGAQLLTLDGTGHDLPPAAWDTVVPAILRHTAGAGGSPARPGARGHLPTRRDVLDTRSPSAVAGATIGSGGGPSSCPHGAWPPFTARSQGETPMTEPLLAASTRTSAVVAAPRDALYRAFTEPRRPGGVAGAGGDDRQGPRVRPPPRRRLRDVALLPGIRARTPRQNRRTGRSLHGPVPGADAPDQDRPGDHLRLGRPRLRWRDDHDRHVRGGRGRDGGDDRLRPPPARHPARGQ